MEGSVVAESSSKKRDLKLIGEMLNEIFNWIQDKTKEFLLHSSYSMTSNLM